MTPEMQKLLEEIREIKVEINFIRHNMPDKDMFLESGEKELLLESFETEQRGELVSEEELRKTLKI